MAHSHSAASLHAARLLPQQRTPTAPRTLLPAGGGLLLRRPHPPLHQQRRSRSSSRPDLRCRRRLLTARGDYDFYENYADEEGDEEEESEVIGGSFDAAVALFNGGEFHACHDVVEELWYTAEEPTRTLLHAILQCAVAFHHLFNQNHRGAMMELGEGLCKLRKLRLDDDTTSPFSRFQEEVAAALNFIYRTQKELAACTDDLCLTMDGSATSYQLLGNFAAGQKLYRLETTTSADGDGVPTIIFSASSRLVRVKLPTLSATEHHLAALQCTSEYI
ncbi:uncharacterized protein [Oryza sativa Japonica Group]|uniref:Os11g0130200 protein n=3 Tax=Oryza sativa TaxID=4530 RepID=B9G971_ORYSJ|nr:uncharacterized protein LOC4349671 [Oryza sativa Japonica Group]EEC67587.1 hypothetical protein OsI_34952 [Oryza sativa Indica Group]KAB8114074.1 hypothetical protein EE612_053302 [Oryza sativa]ABA91310.1 expressed protein [Oryza sativa Japonica Group]EEE51577.1 hypothetical protein OsJ_32810 [Oryza sativa Japonica Group]KAF2909305.1 hypothetical protein DAI22_11g016500 [Oryza sativa Japonica Group]|eukprot:NP_001065649.1 Os11g0130200 [Oryza sativa Japonica Group]